MMKSLTDALRLRLPLVHFVVDSLFWVLGLPLAMWVRFDFDWSAIDADLIWPVLVAVALQGVIGVLSGLYRRRWRYGTFDELKAVAFTTGSAGIILWVSFWWNSEEIPRSVPLMATGFSLLGQVAARSVWRLYNEQWERSPDSGVQNMVVVGAGDGAAQVLRLLRSTPKTGWRPVALVDDDPKKRNLRLSGVPVVASVDQLAAVVQRHHATVVLLAVPSADGPFVRRVTEQAESAGASVLVLPSVDQLLGTVDVADIRPVREEDLLGRHPAEIDTEAVAGYVTGARVLVTGAGGSIGSELCRQLSRFEPAALMMLDRDESGLHGTQLSIHGRAMLDDPNLILADIRDADRVDEVFEQHRPDVVFHAAALKHLPLLEMHPDEGWKTNVLGTVNLLDSARRFGVSRFVNVSTDKAADPTSVLGWTKRITERITAHASLLGPTVCVSVRFGNVLGSAGSVLKAFEVQAEMGGPITVTDREVTRYFMTIEEASRLTIYSGAIGDPGEVMILDMGEPVRILEVAERFAHQYDPPLEIVFTGLRPNEKLHEDLISMDEAGSCRIHPQITHVTAPPLAPGWDSNDGIPKPDQMRSIAGSSAATSESTPLGGGAVDAR